MIYQWYIIGDEHGNKLTLRGIGLRLSEMGVFSPRQNIKRAYQNTIWFADTISVILGNETYCGTWHYLKLEKRAGKMCQRDASERIAVDVPAIVDRDLWERAQARREYNAKMSKRNAKHDYFLRGRVMCKCGRSMVGHGVSTAYGKYYYYVCCSKPYDAYADKPICDQKQIRCDKLDAFTWESVKGLFSDLDRLWSQLKEAQQKELDEQNPKRAELQAVDDFIQQAEAEIDEIAIALRKASGRVGESLKKQMDDANARYDGYIARRAEIQKELGAQTDRRRTNRYNEIRGGRAGGD